MGGSGASGGWGGSRGGAGGCDGPSVIAAVTEAELNTTARIATMATSPKHAPTTQVLHKRAIGHDMRGRSVPDGTSRDVSITESEDTR